MALIHPCILLYKFLSDPLTSHPKISMMKSHLPISFSRHKAHIFFILLVMFGVCHVKCRMPGYPAFFIFGDSLVDAGNNNHIFSLAQANFYPYGIDFNSSWSYKPSGRFCNGKTVVDFIGEYFNLGLIPAYLDPCTTGRAILKGVNYASAGGGILDETGANLIGRRSFDGQIAWFNHTITRLRRLIGRRHTETFINTALYAVIMGSNDYLNNLLVSQNLARGLSNVTAFQNRLLSTMQIQLTTLYQLGARTVVVASLGPIGCIPEQLALWSKDGNCSSQLNKLAENFNVGLQQMLDKLNSNVTDAQFIYADVYGTMASYVQSPSLNGFEVVNEACCGEGQYRGGGGGCRQWTSLCPNRSVYVFWDRFHPTEAVNQKLAQDFIQKFDTLFQIGNKSDIVKSKT